MLPVFKVAAVATLALSTAALTDTVTVDQKDLAFSVDHMTVDAGTTVTFTNSDRTPHNIMIRNGGMIENSGLQRPGEAHEVLFGKAGEYSLICGIHPKMKLKVTVE